MSVLPKIRNPPSRRSGERRLPRQRTLVEREQDILDAVEDRARLDWLSQGEDTGTSNIYLVWQCMLSHQPGDLREVIDMLRKKKRR